MWKSYFLLVFTNPYTVIGSTVYFIIMGLLLGFSYQSEPYDRPTLFKLTSLAQVGFTVTSSCTILNDQRRKILLQANQSFKYGEVWSVLPMLYATYAFFRIFVCFIYSILIYNIAGLRSGVNYYLVFWCTSYGQTLAVLSMMFCVSAITSQKQLQFTIAVSVFMFLLLFSGSFYNTSTVPDEIQWMQYLSSNYYYRISLLLNEFQGNTYEDENGSVVNGDDLLVKWQVQTLGLWGAIGALYGLAAFFFILANPIFWVNLRWNSTRPKAVHT